MYPKLLHIYGPLELNSYNAALMLGISVFFYCAVRHKGREHIISSDDFIAVCIESAIAGIIGGRLLHVISQWQQYSWWDMLAIWNGGLSILGTLIGALIYSTWTLKRKGLFSLAFFDIAALYAPLVHGIARIGCFLVGCCYGCPTDVWWGVTYVHPLVMAPLHVKIHPTQLYSSGMYFALFMGMLFISKKQFRKPGDLVILYLMGMSLERFFVDFFRGDRIIATHTAFSLLSFHQWIALGVFTVALIGLIIRQHTMHAHESL